MYVGFPFFLLAFTLLAIQAPLCASFSYFSARTLSFGSNEIIFNHRPSTVFAEGCAKSVENDSILNQVDKEINIKEKERNIFSCSLFLKRSILLAAVISVATLSLPTLESRDSNLVVNAKEENPMDKSDLDNLSLEYRSKVEKITKDLEEYIGTKNWSEIKEQTKFYDIELRKVIMGKMKGTLTTKEEKVKAQELRNGVTFDLIGINKSARKEDGQEAMRFLGMMREELNDFQKLCFP